MTSRSEREFQTGRIKESVDIVTMVGSYVRLRKCGPEHIGLCPFHSEKTPSFHVNPTRRSWRCFGCNIGGDVFDFVAKIERVDFTEARKLIAARAGIPVTSRKLSETERREWLRQHRQDEQDTERRDALSESLRAKRKTYFQAFHRAKHHIIKHGTDSPGCDFYMTAAETYEVRYLALDRAIERLGDLTLKEFRKLDAKARGDDAIAVISAEDLKPEHLNLLAQSRRQDISDAEQACTSMVTLIATAQIRDGDFPVAEGAAA